MFDQLRTRELALVLRTLIGGSQQEFAVEGAEGVAEAVEAILDSPLPARGFKGSFDESSAVGMLDFQSDLRPRGIEPAELIRLLVVLHDVRPLGTAGALRRPPF